MWYALPMKQLIRTQLSGIAWSLGLVVTGLAVIAWGSGLRWDFTALSPYDLFPLFGLLAFSLMWTHYIVLALRVYADAPGVPLYASVTQRIVLFCLLAHPGILIFSLYQDGFGFPPGSYAAYVGDQLVGYALLGTAAWFAFMSYEFKHWLQRTRWWPLVLVASAIGMLLILLHSLHLGGDLQSGWFRTVWYVYEALLLLAYAYLLAKGRLITMSSSTK